VCFGEIGMNLKCLMEMLDCLVQMASGNQFDA
jgi:hypothetical protein